MDSIKGDVKAEKLLEMYRSVDRMNQHIMRGDADSALSELRLQINLRANFETLVREERI